MMLGEGFDIRDKQMESVASSQLQSSLSSRESVSTPYDGSRRYLRRLNDCNIVAQSIIHPYIPSKLFHVGLFTRAKMSSY